MASVLPSPHTTSFEHSRGHAPLMKSRLSCADDTCTVRRYGLRSNSPASFVTASSLPVGTLGTQKENSPLFGSASSLLNFRLFESCSETKHARRSWSWTVPGELLSPPSLFTPCPSRVDSFEDTALDEAEESNLTELRVTNPDKELSLLDFPAYSFPTSSVASSSELSDATREGVRLVTPELDELSSEYYQGEEAKVQTSPFKRWLNVLKKKHQSPVEILKSPEHRWVLDDLDKVANHTPPRHTVGQSRHHKRQSSVSSVILLTAVKTASVTLASLSLYPRSRRSAQASYLRKEEFSSNATLVRESFDSGVVARRTSVDHGTWARSVQRQRIVEEILSSEESYIRDMKTLVNVYLTVLPRNGQHRRTICKSVGQIIQLHEDLIVHLQAVLKNSQPIQPPNVSRLRHGISRHIRWRSLEGSPPKPLFRHRLERFARHSIDTSRPSLIHTKQFMADTQLVMDVAKVFDKFMQRFLAYEAYAAYNELFGECSASVKTSSTWSDAEKGIEALSSLTTPAVVYEADCHKALSFSDLIVKPIQRICKYPLFFSDLSRQTPACDDPVVHAQLQAVLLRLQRLADEVNHALSNPDIRRQIEISWLLQDRFQFDDENIIKATIFEKLGRVYVYGVLYAAFPTSDSVKGQYMICALYRSTLILAQLTKTLNAYHVAMAIPMINASIDSSDSGRGLQCHTAQFTWKLIFDVERRQHEIIFSACSEKEEEVWKSNLCAQMSAEAADFAEGRANISDSLSIAHPDIKAIGPAFGPFTNFSRRLSIQRAATIGPRPNPQQVIIKNTEAQKYSNSSSTTSVMRSQSHMSSNHIPTLAPRRGERVKLEAMVSDVWTKSVLPFPGMGSRRGDNPIRASASSVMRKLSMASIASNFSKRSMSYSTLSFRVDDECASSSGQSSRTIRTKKVSDKGKRPVLVDFHNAPSAFLPVDFALDIKPTSNLHRRSRKLAARLSMSMDVSTPDAYLPNDGISKNRELLHPATVNEACSTRGLTAHMLDGVGDFLDDPPSSSHSTHQATESNEQPELLGCESTTMPLPREDLTTKPNKPKRKMFKFFI